MNRSVTVAIFLALFLISACSLLSGKKTVRYRVSGSADVVDVTFLNGQENTSQLSGVSVPWSREIEAESGQAVSISAQNQGETGSVTVKIKVDGETIQESSSSGSYVVASASGTVE